MALDIKKINHSQGGYYRFRQLGDEYLLTTDDGSFAFLGKDDFVAFAEGRLDSLSDAYRGLCSSNLIKDDGKINVQKAIEKYRAKKSFLLRGGPCLHIIVVTLRCNQKCVYCHASAQDMNKTEADMTIETADKVLDMIFQTTNDYVDIEFQGGEPLVNWSVVKYVIEEAEKRNEKAGKKLEFKLVSNFSLMDEEKYDFLVGHKVSLSTSLDGPADIHNANRPLLGGDSHAHVAKWIKRFNNDYEKLRETGYIWRMSSLMTISRRALPKYKELIDEYVSLGFVNIFLRPLDGFGFSKSSWDKIGYTPEEFIEFYKKSLDYILEINKSGLVFEERFARFFMIKIMTDYDPGMLDLRSPCGAGIGQLAYNYNGDIYTCDEGRMVSMMDDDSFKIGDVFSSSYEDVVSDPVVKSLCSASCLEGLAGCSDCAYLPYCGTCPIVNYAEQGNIFGQMPSNSRCKINKAVLDYLFEKLHDKENVKVFESWLKRNDYKITAPYCQ
jgi:uncharacterized protein